MSLPPKLTKFTTASPVIATYDFTDIAEGTGVVKFYLFETEITGGAVDYHLGTAVVYSSTLMIGGSYADLDYDLTQFNIPKTIGGTAIINMPWHIFPGGTTMTLTLVCKLKKNDVVIATVTSPTASVAGGEAETGNVWCFPMTIPQTHFAAGDVLRLTIEATSTGGSGGSQLASYGIDPVSRSFLSQTVTQSSINIPFRLDV